MLIRVSAHITCFDKDKFNEEFERKFGLRHTVDLTFRTAYPNFCWCPKPDPEPTMKSAASDSGPILFGKGADRVVEHVNGDEVYDNKRQD